MAESRRINPDSIQALWFTVGLVGFLVATSFMVSFAGLTEVAVWVGLPPWMRWTIPAFIDVAILAYALAVLIHRSRGEATWPSWVSLGLFTVVSVIANAAHALSIGHEVVWQAVIGAGLAALAPVGVFAATEELGRLVVERADKAEPASSGEQAADLVQVNPELPAEPVKAVEAPAAPAPAPAPRPVVKPEPVPEPELVVAPSIVPTVESDNDSDDDDPTDPSPRDPQGTDKSKDNAPMDTPLFDQVQEKAAEPAPAPATVSAPAPVLKVVERKAPATQISEIDPLIRWVQAEVADGRTPTAKGVAQLLEVSERTGRRKLATLKDSRPELFTKAASAAWKEA